MHRYRSHTCGQLRAADVDTDVRLSGWLHNRRNLGGILFIDLRDHYGLVQLVVRPDTAANEKLGSISKESVVRVDGRVIARGADNVNPELPTGEIEVEVADVEVLGAADPLPFTVFPEDGVGEERRLEHRFLDLRRERMHRNIMLRSAVISAIRQKMTAQGFNEMATPILSATSPEGARDFLVPSRLHAGRFYALPQAPQQFKQLLMIAGFDRYFQIAPCFRDEDARADRSPGEFYQLDVEMSFVEQEDVFEVIEKVMTELFEEFGGGRVCHLAVPADPVPRGHAEVRLRQAGPAGPAGTGRRHPRLRGLRLQGVRRQARARAGRAGHRRASRASSSTSSASSRSCTAPRAWPGSGSATTPS